MKKLFIAFALVGLFSACSTTDYDHYAAIAGVVVDAENGEPISQVAVTLSPGGNNSYTGSDGQFNFKDVDSQQYTVQVQKTGYVANRKTVDAVAGETVNVSITMEKQR